MKQIMFYCLLTIGLISSVFCAQEQKVLASDKIPQVTCVGISLPGMNGKHFEQLINGAAKSFTFHELTPDYQATNMESIGTFKVNNTTYIYSIYDPKAAQYGAPQKFTKEDRDVIYKIAKEEYDAKVKAMKAYADYLVKRGFCKYK